MKDISIYFASFGEKGNYKKNQIGESIIINSLDDFSHPSKNDIALIFIPEYRNSELTISDSAIDDVRKSFYSLFKGEWKNEIYDLYNRNF